MDVRAGRSLASGLGGLCRDEGPGWKRDYNSDRGQNGRKVPGPALQAKVRRIYSFVKVPTSEIASKIRHVFS